MFYVLSKTVGLLSDPLTLFLLAVFLIVLALWTGRRRIAGTLATLLLLVGLGVCFTNVGSMMLGVLETRFPRPADPPQVDGIILLGGGFSGGPSRQYGIAELNDAGDRLVETLRLAERYPDAPIVATGGLGALSGSGTSDAILIPRFFETMGIDPARVIVEGEARNTAENASLTAALIGERYPAGGTWLLVTSAFHMPRSVGVFRKAGLDLVPWPADFRSDGHTFSFEFDDPTGRVLDVAVAMKEFVGLVAYSVAGYTSELLPGARTAAAP